MKPVVTMGILSGLIIGVLTGIITFQEANAGGTTQEFTLEIGETKTISFPNSNIERLKFSVYFNSIGTSGGNCPDININNLRLKNNLIGTPSEPGESGQFIQSGFQGSGFSRLSGIELINDCPTKNVRVTYEYTPSPERHPCPDPNDEPPCGCLIATAAFGSELSPQVQLLREIRDNQLLKTESGSAFMHSFNSIYYTFAPTIANWENENPTFKEIVKISITPLISSLSLLHLVEMDSETEVLVYGISMILLNIGMYVAAPVGLVIFVKRKV